MRKLRVAICDDEAMMGDMISNYIVSVLAPMGVETSLETFSNGKAFLKRSEKLHFDLAFLDIHMPGLDGLALGRVLRERDDCPELIYVTSREDKVWESFSVRPFGFVRKSHFFEDANRVIKEYLEKKALEDDSSSIVIRTRDSVTVVNAAQILYIEGRNVNQELHLAGGKEPVLMRSTMDELEKELGKFDFFRIHRGYLINLSFVREFNQSDVTLSDGTKLPMSRQKTAAMKTRYFEYLRKRKISII